tara:strand:- start:577 stop:819 length:243 start_codon:yes stop_codon:yes gene_type:complete
MAIKTSTKNTPVKNTPVKKTPVQKPAVKSGLKTLFSSKNKAKMADEIMKGVKIPMIPKKHKSRAVGMIFNVMEKFSKTMK